jgi:hypothetical protein
MMAPGWPQAAPAPALPLRAQKANSSIFSPTKPLTTAFLQEIDVLDVRCSSFSELELAALTIHYLKPQDQRNTPIISVFCLPESRS